MDNEVKKEIDNYTIEELLSIYDSILEHEKYLDESMLSEEESDGSSDESGK